MLFNSFPFLFGFLPLALSGYFLLRARGFPHGALAFLGGMSLLFYSWWDWRFLPLLMISILFNYGVGCLLSRHRQPSRSDRWLLAGRIAIDLSLLAYFKYANFFLATANSVFDLQLPFAAIVLPLGISFFTFTQIAWLVDAFRKEVRDTDFTRYLLFVTFFPHLIAGPVLHHAEIMPQFRKARVARWPVNFSVGFTLFCIGLFKKTVLADNLAEFATPVFVATQHGELLGTKAAWGGALAYTLQLYFDFSAYSDMAIGLALLFGVRFPTNFNSPYQADSIIDFWRRWHMTLSRFLRDYLYIPLGGGHCGRLQRLRNLMLTMLLGGLWHGAGWTFVIWGGLHGVFLVINHLWRDVRHRAARPAPIPAWVAQLLSRALTFLAVVVAWVFFRADSAQGALTILRAMVGLGAPGASDPLFAGSSEIRWLVAGLLLVHCCPNALQILHRFRPALETYGGEIAPPSRSWLAWQPSLRWGIVTALAGVAGILNLTRVSEFLYFQF